MWNHSNQRLPSNRARRSSQLRACFPIPQPLALFMDIVSSRYVYASRLVGWYNRYRDFEGTAASQDIELRGYKGLT